MARLDTPMDTFSRLEMDLIKVFSSLTDFNSKDKRGILANFEFCPKFRGFDSSAPVFFSSPAVSHGTCQVLRGFYLVI